MSLHHLEMQIFICNVYCRYPTAATEVTLKSIERSMYNWKGSEPIMPKLTEGIVQFHDMLEKKEWSERLKYPGGELTSKLIASGSEYSLLMWNETFAEKFIDCEQIFMDATYSRFPLIAPKKNLRTHSLFTIHVLYENNVSNSRHFYVYF